MFVILECGLYHEKKRYICMSKCGRNVLKTQRYDSVLSPLFFLLFNLLKSAAKFMRTESVKCPACALSQACAYYVTQFTYKSYKSTDLNYSISRVSYVHSSRTTDESPHYFARSADFEFQLILYLGPSTFGSEIVLKN